MNLWLVISETGIDPFDTQYNAANVTGFVVVAFEALGDCSLRFDVIDQLGTADRRVDQLVHLHELLEIQIHYRIC